jgi:dihydropteroate synthase
MILLPNFANSAESSWAGLNLDRPLVMGILNVTPDSFSDGGRWTDTDDAVAAGLAMAADGAAIIDVGGESTRPGAAAISIAEEQDRILPVIQRLAAAGICVSADTRHAATMRAALAAGARIVNDVSGLTHDPLAAAEVAAHACPVVLMHMRGTPATMASQAVYRDVVAEVRTELMARVDAALRAGVRQQQIAVDPGIGFAKRSDHSQAILRQLADLTSLGFPVLVGVSRKSFIGALSGEPQPDRRLGGSLAAGVFAVSQGAAIIRVHDVRETVQALRVWHLLFGRGTVAFPQRSGVHPVVRDEATDRT